MNWAIYYVFNFLIIIIFSNCLLKIMTLCEQMKFRSISYYDFKLLNELLLLCGGGSVNKHLGYNI